MLRVSRVIHASPERLWAELARIEDHVTWMRDARSITFTSELTRGVGTSFVCLTRVGPLTTRDVMTVTEWVEPVTMGVAHRGAVRGVGTFRLRPLDAGTTELTWEEELVFPPYFAGALGERLARPVLAALWRGNLRRLGERVATPE